MDEQNYLNGYEEKSSCRCHSVYAAVCRLAYRHAAGRIKKPPVNRAVTTNSNKMSIEESITWKLTDRFNPIHLAVVNESNMHNVPKGSETHFKVVVVSQVFSGMPLIKRHRLVNDTLEKEFCSGVHALSIVAKTPDQWDGSGEVEKSPPCRGGAGL